MDERVEWCVLRVTKEGKIEYHSEGAQSRFGKTKALQIAKSLGLPWVVNHFYTLVPPEAHEQWLGQFRAADAQGASRYLDAEARELRDPSLQHIIEQIPR